MNNYLFITHFTPKKKRTKLREILIDGYMRALKNQTYDRWKVLIIGEEEKEDEFIKVVYANQETNFKEQLKQIYEREDVKRCLADADYILKLDDDDVISPDILRKLSKEDFDVYFDQYHTFYDITSGRSSQKYRNWIAATCIHKASHAMSKYDPNGEDNFYTNSLFYQDHSKAWLSYYQDKKIVIADKAHPLYTRILSPTSITAGSNKVSNLSEIDFTPYKSYLDGFGQWDDHIEWFQVYTDFYEQQWRSFSGRDFVEYQFSNQQNKLKRLIKKLLPKDKIGA